MTKTFRKIAFVTMILIFLLAFMSCLNTDDGTERTASIEQQEINEVLTNLTTKRIQCRYHSFGFILCDE